MRNHDRRLNVLEQRNRHRSGYHCITLFERFPRQTIEEAMKEKGVSKSREKFNVIIFIRPISANRPKETDNDELPNGVSGSWKPGDRLSDPVDDLAETLTNPMVNGEEPDNVEPYGENK